MRRLVVWATALALLFCVWAGPVAARKKSSSKKTVAKTTAKSTTTGKGTKGARKSTKTTWRNRQSAPTPERYREIQQALAAKGYLRTDQVTGTWTSDSADAMRKFQTDQKLDSSGKINSRSLIALGLGPKPAAAEAKPTVGQEPPPADKPGQ